MGKLFSSPKAPALPPAPPLAPSRADAAADRNDAYNARRRARNASGFVGSILTGARNTDGDDVVIRKKTLLGGN